MFYRLLISFILLGNFSYAQLSVVNDGDDDTPNHYIFVKDEVLTVTQEVNLRDSDSRIYFRDEAQLVQINENAYNEGVGEISLYQEGHANQFQHNFWCSPVGNKTNSTSNNDFSISLLNDIENTTESTPASIDNSNYNSTTGDLSDGGSSPMSIASYWVFTYPDGDGGVGGWVHTQTGDIQPGYGFSMKGTNHASGQQPYDFRGKPNNGEISISVDAGNFSLIGNPYPSALDAHAFIWDADNKDKFDGVLRFYEDNSNSHYYVDYQSGYATFTTSETDANDITALPAVYRTYNDDGSINDSNTGNGSVSPERYIPIGQGFMIKMNDLLGGGDGNIKIKNSHRVYETETGGESVFAKSQNTKNKSKQVTSSGFSKISESYKRFRLNIDFNETYTRQLVSNFHPSATTGFDRGLEIKVDETFLLSSDAYLGNNFYVAEALPFDEALKMPLKMQLASDMPVRMRIADVQNFDDNQSIFIHDLETNIFINLRQQDFNINLDAGDYNDRFEITFANNSISLDTEDAIFQGFKVVQNNIASKLIVLNPKALNIATISLFDISGKLILNNNANSTKNKVSISTRGLSNGVYVTKINTDDNQVFTKKVVISNAR